MFFRLVTRVTAIVVLTSFMFTQLAWASMYNSWVNTDYQTAEEMQQEGFIGEEYIDTLDDMEHFQEEKIKEINEFTSTLDASEKGVFNSIEDTIARTQETNDITGFLQNNAISDLQNMSSQMAALIDSYDTHYVLYKNGKKVWVEAGKVTNIDNEKFYDKHGNEFVRNTNWMTYNEDNQLTYYESTVLDSLGNTTTVRWEDAVYYTDTDQLSDSSHKAGELASYKETSTDKAGVTTVTEWSNVSYYTNDDELADISQLSGKMSSYTKSVVSDVTPDKIDIISTSNIKYLKREKAINELAYDPTFEEASMKEDDYYDFLITSFDETKESLGINSDRNWGNALYNDYSEVTYYEESSTTLGVSTNRTFSDAIYDTYGRIISFKDISETYGISREQTRSGMQYNDLDQVIAYNDVIVEDGVTTEFTVNNVNYNDNGQISSMHQLITTSEGFSRDLVKSEMLYDSKGLITHYREVYTDNGITYNLERTNIVHNSNGFQISYNDLLTETGSYTDFAGTVVTINNTSSVNRVSTTYDSSGNVTSYTENKTDENGTVTAVTRSNMLYSNGNLTSYDEVQNISTEFSQRALGLNELNELTLSDGEYVLTNETINLNYTINKTFSAAAYIGKKIQGYTETTVDSRKPNQTITVTRNEQTYNEKGQILSYKENISIDNDGTVTNESRIWKDAAYDANGNIAGYSETYTNASGGITFSSWEAKAYNPINQVQAYTQTDIVDGVITVTARKNIKYDSLGRMLAYEESFQDGQKLPEETVWEALGYNLSGMLTGYRELTQTGDMTKENVRNHITYNQYGRIIRYVESLQETGSYIDLSGAEILIDRSTKVERIDTQFNELDQMESFIQKEYTPEGFTHKVNKNQITYSAEGNILSYTETRTISGSGMQNDLSAFDYATGMSVSVTAPISLNYTTVKVVENGTYDELNRMTGYKETLTDTRKSSETIIAERTNQSYGDGGNIVSYNELVTTQKGADIYFNDTAWSGSYDGSSRLSSYNTASIDSNNITREKSWEVLGFNVLNLMTGYKEINIIKDGEAELLRTSSERDNICYDNFNRVRAYTETNTNARGYSTEKIWMGAYGDLGLLNNDVTQIIDAGFITNVASFYTYNSDGNMFKKLSSQEEFLKEGFTLNEYTNANTKFFDLLSNSVLTYPSDVSLHKVTYAYRTDTVYDEFGRVVGSTDINYDAYGNTVTTTKSGVTFNSSNLETSYIQDTAYNYLTSEVNPDGLNYEVHKEYSASSFTKTAMPIETIETVSDTRKPITTTTITKSNLSYNDLGLVTHYNESIADSYFNAELNDTIINVQNTIRDITYADNGKVVSYDETLTNIKDTTIQHIVPTNILDDLELSPGGTIESERADNGDIILNKTLEESYGWLCGMMPNYDLSSKRYLNLRFKASSVGEFKIELKNTEDQLITDSIIVVPVGASVGEESVYTIDLKSLGLKPNSILNFMAITDPKGNDIRINEFDFAEFSLTDYEDNSYTRSYNCDYNAAGLVSEYNETVTKDGKTTQTNVDNIAYDAFGNKIFAYTKVVDQYGKNNYTVGSYSYEDGFMSASIECINSDYSSALYSLNTRSNIVYDSKGNLKSYNDNNKIIGEYYNSYDADGVGLGQKIVVDALQTNIRINTLYNDLNQVVSFSEENVDASGLKTEITRSDIQYTFLGYMDNYNNVAVYSDSTGLDPYTYTLTTLYAATGFSDEGQPLNTVETIVDSRKSSLTSTITKNYTYDQDGLVSSLHENMKEESNDASMEYQNNAVKMRTDIVYADGKMISYKEEGNFSSAAALSGTVWTKSFYDATYNALNGMLDQETTTVEKYGADSDVTPLSVIKTATGNITYDSKMRRDGYTTTSISGFGFPEAVNRTVLTENIIYDSFGRESGFITKEDNGGVLTTTQRDNIAYTYDDGSDNYFGNIDSYREIKIITGNSDISAVADINTVSVSYRDNTCYNKYGWVTSTTDRLYETVDLSLFDWVNIESPAGTKETIVIRQNTGFTTTGEVTEYNEELTVSEKGNPSGLSWDVNTLHTTNSFDSIGQETSYKENKTDSRTPLINTITLREGMAYDSVLQLKTYTDTIIEGNGDLESGYYLQTKTERTNTVYDSFGRVTYYAEKVTESHDTGKINTVATPSTYIFTDILDSLIFDGSTDISYTLASGGDVSFSTSNGYLGAMMPNYDLGARNFLNLRVSTTGPSRFWVEIKNTSSPDEVVTGNGFCINLPDTGGLEETITVDLSSKITVENKELNYMAIIGPEGAFTIHDLDFNEFDRVAEENLDPVYEPVFDTTVSEINSSFSYYGDTQFLQNTNEATLKKDIYGNPLSNIENRKENSIYDVNGREFGYSQIQEMGSGSEYQVTTEIEFENIKYDFMGMQTSYTEKEINDTLVISREKNNITYTLDNGTDTAYGLIDSYDEIVHISNAQGSALITDTVSKLSRISTSYDNYGRVVGYTEQSLASIAADEDNYNNTVFSEGIQQTDTVRSGIKYSRTGQLIGYEEEVVVSEKDIPNSTYTLNKEYEVTNYNLKGIISLKETVTDSRTPAKIAEVVKSSQTYNQAGMIDSFIERTIEKDINDAKKLNVVVETVRSSTTYDDLGRMIAYSEKTTNTVDTLNLLENDALPASVIDGASWNEDNTNGDLTYNSTNGLLNFQDTVPDGVNCYIWGDLASREDIALNPVVNLKVRTNGYTGQSGSVYLELFNEDIKSITDIPETTDINEKIKFDIPDTEGEWKIISIDTSDMQVSDNTIVAITCFSDPDGAPIDVEALFFSDAKFEVYQNITESYITESNWTGNYYGTSSMLSAFSENIKVRDRDDNLIKESITQKTDITYDAKLQESGYTLTDTFGTDVTESIFSSITYDQLGRQTGYQTSSISNGIEYTAIRENMTYDENHHLNSYDEVVHEASVAGAEVAIDKVSKIVRNETLYNDFGQVTGYTQVAYDPKAPVDVNWENTTFADTDLKTITNRSKIDYSKYGQLTRYEDINRVLGTETQNKTILSYNSEGEPIETQEFVVCNLDYVMENTYEVLEYDFMGRVLQTFETSRDDRRFDITTETKKIISGYDQFGRIVSSSSIMKEKQRDTGVVKSMTETAKHDISYYNNTNIILSYTDDYTQYYAADSVDFSIPRSKWKREFSGECYTDGNGSSIDYYKNTTESTIKTFLNKETVEDGDGNVIKVIITPEETMKTTNVRTGTSKDSEYAGIGYDSLGRVVSYRDESSSENLVEGLVNIGTVFESWNQTYNSLGLSSGYEQSTGYVGMPESMDHTIWGNALYDSFGRNISSYQITTDAGGMKTYSSYNNAVFDSYGRLLSYDKNDIEYLEAGIENINGNEISYGLNRSVITNWSVVEIGDVLQFDDQDRAVNTMTKVETKQGDIHTYKETKAESIYDNATGDIYESKEIEKTFDVDTKAMLICTETSIKGINYDGLGRKKGYTSLIKQGMNDPADPATADNVIMEERYRNNIVYDEFGRVIAYRDDIYKENFLETYSTVIRSSTQYDDYIGNNTGKISGYTEYRATIKPDETLNNAEKLTAVVDEVLTAYGENFLNASIINNDNFYTTKNIVEFDYFSSGMLASQQTEEINYRADAVNDGYKSEISTSAFDYDAYGNITAKNYMLKEGLADSELGLDSSPTKTIFQSDKIDIVYNKRGHEISWKDEQTDILGNTKKITRTDTIYNRIGQEERYEQTISETITVALPLSEEELISGNDIDIANAGIDQSPLNTLSGTGERYVSVEKVTQEILQKAFYDIDTNIRTYSWIRKDIDNFGVISGNIDDPLVHSTLLELGFVPENDYKTVVLEDGEKKIHRKEFVDVYSEYSFDSYGKTTESTITTKSSNEPNLTLIDHKTNIAYDDYGRENSFDNCYTKTGLDVYGNALEYKEYTFRNHTNYDLYDREIGFSATTSNTIATRGIDLIRRDVTYNDLNQITGYTEEAATSADDSYSSLTIFKDIAYDSQGNRTDYTQFFKETDHTSNITRSTITQKDNTFIDALGNVVFYTERKLDVLGDMSESDFINNTVTDTGKITDTVYQGGRYVATGEYDGFLRTLKIKDDVSFSYDNNLVDSSDYDEVIVTHRYGQVRNLLGDNRDYFETEISSKTPQLITARTVTDTIPHIWGHTDRETKSETVYSFADNGESFWEKTITRKEAIMPNLVTGKPENQRIIQTFYMDKDNEFTPDKIVETDEHIKSYTHLECPKEVTRIMKITTNGSEPMDTVVLKKVDTVYFYDQNLRVFEERSAESIYDGETEWSEDLEPSVIKQTTVFSAYDDEGRITDQSITTENHTDNALRISSGYDPLKTVQNKWYLYTGTNKLHNEIVYYNQTKKLDGTVVKVSEKAERNIQYNDAGARISYTTQYKEGSSADDLKTMYTNSVEITSLDGKGRALSESITGGINYIYNGDTVTEAAFSETKTDIVYDADSNISEYVLNRSEEGKPDTVNLHSFTLLDGLGRLSLDRKTDNLGIITEKRNVSYDVAGREQTFIKEIIRPDGFTDVVVRTSTVYNADSKVTETKENVYKTKDGVQGIVYERTTDNIVYSDDNRVLSRNVADRLYSLGEVNLPVERLRIDEKTDDAVWDAYQTLIANYMAEAKDAITANGAENVSIGSETAQDIFARTNDWQEVYKAYAFAAIESTGIIPIANLTKDEIIAEYKKLYSEYLTEGSKALDKMAALGIVIDPIYTKTADEITTEYNEVLAKHKEECPDAIDIVGVETLIVNSNGETAQEAYDRTGDWQLVYDEYALFQLEVAPILETRAKTNDEVLVSIAEAASELLQNYKTEAEQVITADGADNILIGTETAQEIYTRTGDWQNVYSEYALNKIANTGLAVTSATTEAELQTAYQNLYEDYASEGEKALLKMQNLSIYVSTEHTKDTVEIADETSAKRLEYTVESVSVIDENGADNVIVNSSGQTAQELFDLENQNWQKVYEAYADFMLETNPISATRTKTAAELLSSVGEAASALFDSWAAEGENAIAAGGASNVFIGAETAHDIFERTADWQKVYEAYALMKVSASGLSTTRDATKEEIVPQYRSLFNNYVAEATTLVANNGAANVTIGTGTAQDVFTSTNDWQEVYEKYALGKMLSNTSLVASSEEKKVVVYELGMGQVAFYEEIKSETLTYDNYGRIQATETDISQADGLTKNQTYEVISRDADGNVSEQLTTIVDNKNRTLINRESNITYNEYNQKISYDIESTDKYGNRYFKNRSNLTYDENRMLSGYQETDYPNSYKPAQGVLTMSGMTYDENGKQSGFSRSGTDYLGNSYNETRNNCVYDDFGRLSGYSSSGDNQGIVYNYVKSDIYYASSDGTGIEKGEIYSYQESGVNSKNGTYTSIHSNMQYNTQGKIIYEREEGTRKGVSFGEDKTFTYYDEMHSSAGLLSGSVIDSFTSSDITTRENIVYNDEGKVVNERQFGIRSNQEFDNNITKTYYAEGTPYAGKMHTMVTTPSAPVAAPQMLMAVAAAPLGGDMSTQEVLEYDGMGRIIKERNYGTADGRSFDNIIERAYYAAGAYIGKESNIYTTDQDGNVDSKLNITYDAAGNIAFFVANGTRDGNTYNIGTTLTYRYDATAGKTVINSKAEHGTSNGKAVHRLQNNYRYDSAGRTVAYIEQQVAYGTNIPNGYRRDITSMTYNDQNDLISMVYTDTRNNSFSTKGEWYLAKITAAERYWYNVSNQRANNIVEYYDRDASGDIVTTRMYTPDYTAYFNDAGARTYFAYTTQYNIWLDQEKHEAQDRQFRAWEHECIDIINSGGASNYILNGRSIQDIIDSYAPYYNKGVVAAYREYAFMKRNKNVLVINIDALDSATIHKIISTIVKKSNEPENEKLLANLEKLISKAKEDESTNKEEDIKNALKGKKKVVKKSMVFMLKRPKDVSIEDFKEAINEVIEELIGVNIDTTGDLNDYGYDEVFEAIMGGSISFYAYDAGGELVWGFELAAYELQDGTRYTKVSRTEEVDGQLITQMRETFNGPTGNYVVDSFTDGNGVTTKHIYGIQAYGHKIDETRVSRTETIDGGFRVITQILDNLTGAKSKEVSTYTNIKYHKGKMVEYNLTKVVTGTRFQNGRLEKLHLVTKIKQYGAKFDEKGRLIEYKQDIWKNSAPNKHTTVLYQNLAFNTKDQVIEQIITTHEWGRGTDGEGGSIILDATTVAHRSNIVYDEQGRVISFTEYTYDPNGDMTNTSQSDIVYDYAGRMVAYRNEGGDSARFIYDNMGLVKASEVFGEYTYDVVYDTGGNKIQWYTARDVDSQQVDGVHSATYNELGQQIVVYSHEYSHGKMFSQNEEDITTYTYDVNGYKQILTQNILNDKYENESAVREYMPYVNIVAAIVGCIPVFGWALAAGIVTSARMVLGLSDGESFGEAYINSRLEGAKAALMAYVGGNIANAVKAGFTAANTAKALMAIASITAVNMMQGQDFDDSLKNATIFVATAIAAGAAFKSMQANFASQVEANGIWSALGSKSGAMYMGSNLAFNTTVNMALGQEFEDAVENGLIQTAGSTVATIAAVEVNKYLGDIKFGDDLQLKDFIDTGINNKISEKVELSVQDAIVKGMKDAIFAELQEEIAEKNDEFMTTITSGLMNSFLNYASQKFNDNPNVDWKDAFATKDIVDGVVKGSYKAWLADQQAEGHINAEWGVFLERAGFEAIDHIKFDHIIMAISTDLADYMYDTIYKHPLPEAYAKGTAKIETYEIDANGDTVGAVKKIDTIFKRSIDFVNGERNLTLDDETATDSLALAYRNNDQDTFLDLCLNDSDIAPKFYNDNNIILTDLKLDGKGGAPVHGSMIDDCEIVNNQKTKTHTILINGFNNTRHEVFGIGSNMLNLANTLKNNGLAGTIEIAHFQADTGFYAAKTKRAPISAKSLVALVENRVAEFKDPAGMNAAVTKINIVAHSLGNEVVKLASADLKAKGIELNVVTSVNGAISNQSFNDGQSGKDLVDISNKLLVLYSKHDTVLDYGSWNIIKEGAYPKFEVLNDNIFYDSALGSTGYLGQNDKVVNINMSEELGKSIDHTLFSAYLNAQDVDFINNLVSAINE